MQWFINVLESFYSPKICCTYASCTKVDMLNGSVLVPVSPSMALAALLCSQQGCWEKVMNLDSSCFVVENFTKWLKLFLLEDPNMTRRHGPHPAFRFFLKNTKCLLKCWKIAYVVGDRWCLYSHITLKLISVHRKTLLSRTVMWFFPPCWDCYRNSV